MATALAMTAGALRTEGGGGVSGGDAFMPFTLTLTPQYVAREVKKKLPVSYLTKPSLLRNSRNAKRA